MSKENILGTLVVVVLKARHLIDNHTFYKQDPYAKLSLSGATKQTPPDPKGGQHPVWDAELRFPISRDASKNNRTLTISVFSEEKKEDELLGEGSVDIMDTLKTGEFDDWVPLSLKGTQRGDVYLEMTFFAAGPAPLTRRPTKFTSPSERLGRPQQPAVTQQPQRVTSQPPSSPLTLQGQQGPRINTQDVSKQRPSRVQQSRLPGAWPGPSAQHQQLPPEPEPKQEFVPSILRPGGPSHSGNTSPNAHIAQPHPAHQNTPPLPGSSASQSHFSSSSPSLEAQPLHAHSPRISSYSGQGAPGQGGYIPASNGHPMTQPSSGHPHNLPSQPSPRQQQQTQHPASQPAPYASPYPPNNNSAAQTHVPHHTSTQPVPAYVATQSPAPSAFSSSHVPHAQQHAATLSPAPPVHHATSLSAAPPSPPSHLYPVTSGPPSRPPLAHSSAPQSYTASPVPFTSPYSAPTSPNLQAQPYISPLGPVLTHPVQPRLSPPSSPPHTHTQSYFSPPNGIFPLPTSPPPGPSYGHSYEPAPALSFPVPQSTPDYFGTGRPLSPSHHPPPPFSAPDVEPELPDPYLLKRYRTPLPLPPGSNRAHSAQPKPYAPAAAASSRRQDESERAAREMQRREEENARARREQEERDAELARTLDLELNMDGSGEPGRPSLPPRHAQSVGGQRPGMPGSW